MPQIHRYIHILHYIHYIHTLHYIHWKYKCIHMKLHTCTHIYIYMHANKCGSMWPAHKRIRFFIVWGAWANVTLGIFDFNIVFFRNCTCQNLAQKKNCLCFACFAFTPLKDMPLHVASPAKGSDFSMVRRAWANVTLVILHCNFVFFWNPPAKIWLRK